MKPKLVATHDGIEFYSPYDAALVADIKALPYMDRKWDTTAKCWIVAMKHKDALSKLCVKHLGLAPTLQGIFSLNQQKHTKLFRLEYIGGLKDRGDGKLSALGALIPLHKGRATDLMPPNSYLEWNVLLYESVLRQFFEGEENESVVFTTHYSALGLKRDVPHEEIKKAWRQMVRRYHPDVNRDDDAAEMTRRINEAYEVLRNPVMRKKYDAGLELERRAGGNSGLVGGGKHWAIPKRCGLLLCDGYYEAGRFIVEKILDWQPIIENGRELITSWDSVNNSLIRSWL